MDHSELSEFHYITPVPNVASILQHGILCHNWARRFQHTSVAMIKIQERRKDKRIPGGYRLHHCVNLYVNARNPMMYKVQAERGIDNICVLSVSPDVLALPGAVVADRNAASDYVRFSPALEGLALLDHDTVFSRYWTHPGELLVEWQHKSAMCAEVLVPKVVPPTFVQCAYVGSKQAEQRLKSAVPGLTVTSNDYLFFR